MIKYKEGYKYQLQEDYSIQTKIVGFSAETLFIKLESNGLLTCYRGYAWDGPSGPAPDILTFMRASLVHDALYQLMRLDLIPSSCRCLADELMYAICLDAGMTKLLAYWCYLAVHNFSEKYATKAKDRPILEAP